MDHSLRSSTGTRLMLKMELSDSTNSAKMSTRLTSESAAQQLSSVDNASEELLVYKLQILEDR